MADDPKDPETQEFEAKFERFVQGDSGAPVLEQESGDPASAASGEDRAILADDGTASAGPRRRSRRGSDPERAIAERQTGSSRFQLEGRAWAALCLGVGECGAKIAALFNKKPDGLDSRHPDSYPIFAAVFDTQAGIQEVLDQPQWAGEPKLYYYGIPPLDAPDLVKAARATGSGQDRDAGLSIFDLEMQLQQLTGVGGVHVRGRWAFKNFFDTDSEDKENAASQLLNNILQDLTETERLDSIGKLGLITINSGRGGTGSGGAPFVAQFIHDRIKVPSFSLNITILPTAAEIKSKQEFFPVHALASMHSMMSPYVDGVLLFDNEVLASRFEFAANEFYKINYIIHEMIAPFLVTPMGRHSVSHLAKQMDPADIWQRVRGDNGETSFCAVGYAVATLELLESQTVEQILETLCHDVTKELSVDAEFVDPCSFVAILTAPESFYGHCVRQQVPLTDLLISNMTDRMQESISKSPAINKPRITGDIGVLAYPAASTIRLSAIFAPVRVQKLEALVKEALVGRKSLNKNDALLTLKSLTQVEVDELAVGELRRVAKERTRIL